MNNSDIFIDFGQNIAIALSLIFIFSLIRPYLKQAPKSIYKISMGLLFGLIAFIGMLFPIEITSGVIIDGRIVVVALAGLFGGWEVAFIALCMAGGYRIYLGGVGTIPGVGALVGSAVIGVWGCKLWSYKVRYWHVWQFILFGIVLAIQSLLWTFLLPQEIAWPAFQLFALPVIVFYPVGTFLLGMFFAYQLRRFESEDKFQNLVNGSVEGILVYQDDKPCFVNPAYAQMLGYDPSEILAMDSILPIIAPYDRERLIKYKNARMSGEFAPTAYEFDALCKDGSIITVQQLVTMIRWEGQPAILSSIIDLTEMKKAELLLRHSQESLLRSQHIAKIGNYEWDLKTNALEWSEEMYNIFGVDPQTFSPNVEEFEQFVYPDDLHIISPASFAKAFSSKLHELEFRIVAQNSGEVKTIHLWGETTFDDEGNPIHVSAALQDITDRILIEDALKESNENLRITLDSIGDAVIVTDALGRVTRMNPIAESLTGWSLAEAEGVPIEGVFRIVHEETGDVVLSPVKEVLATGESVKLANHTTLIAKYGAEYQIADSGAPIRDREDNILGTVLVFRDVTERQRIEQELLKVKKLESLGLLAGGIAHDFNNLLTGLYGNLELVKLIVPSDHRASKYLKQAEKSMERAIRLTDQLLTFAKGGDPIKDTLALGEVIVETAEFSLHGTAVKLQTDIDSDLWLVEADKGQISQVISNLVINAQQAMPTGGTLTIAAKNVRAAETKQVQITVQDEGTGIPTQYLDKIFDPYFSTKQKGSGLGLASCYSIIDKHNGRIYVESELNQGTIFTVTLPATERESDNPFSKEANGKTIGAARILVLDDEELIRETIGSMLEMMGHHVEFAVDGSGLVDKYQQNFNEGSGFDIVITDLTIPGGMGGQEAAQKILKIDPKANLIVSSGYAHDPIMADYQAYGFRGIVVKPYQFIKLQTVVNQLLSNSS